jgi:hypothetical protein
MDEKINQYIALWGDNYQKHPLAHKVGFIPTKWLLKITSDRKFDFASNTIHGDILDGERLNQNICKEGMHHPIIVSINGVGDDYKILLDCGQHRVRIAHHIAHIEALPCFVEVSHGKSSVIRNLNGNHEYALNSNSLLRKPSVIEQFENPDDIFRRYQLSDIQ